MRYRVTRVVKLRSKPAQDSPNPHGRVDLDDKITIIAKNNEWRQVTVVDRFARTHREGFIKAKYLLEKEPTEDSTIIDYEPPVTVSEPFTATGKPLTQENMDAACDLLHVNEAKVWAVLAVETHGFGFFDNRKPRILFERHIFHRHTSGEFDDQPDISNINPGGYIGGKKEYIRLEKALSLNHQAALMSASWGIGQVMGFNFQSAGFSSPRKMVDAMLEDEGSQLPAMINFIKDHDLNIALQYSNWEMFARGYNGSEFKKNDYDTRLARANAKYEVKLPNLKLRSAQAALTYLGYKPGPVDGLRGRRTHSALIQYQEHATIAVTGELNEQTGIHLIKAAYK